MDEARKGRNPRPRLPITPSILRKIKAVWLSKGVSADRLMLWAASTTAFFGFCRSGEVTVSSGSSYDPQTHLSYSDLAVDQSSDPSMVSIVLKHSKTDQARKGMKIVVGKTGDDLCPVRALLTYLNARGSHPGPLFQWSSGIPLCKAKFIDEVRLTL